MKIYNFPLFHHLIILSFIIGLNILPAQTLDKNKILAYAGDKIITVGEFTKRFEMTPRVDNHETISKQKEEFLYTLIHEKLWAEFAESQGLSNSPLVKVSLREIKKMFTRDELYKREVMSKIIIPKNEVLSESQKCSFTLYINYLISKDKFEIDKLYSKLSAGESFTSILKERNEYKEQRKPIPVECGQVDSAREELFYSLQPGHFSKPVKTELGWTIFYLKEKVSKSPAERNAYIAKARKIVEKRKYSGAYAEFNKKYLAGKKIKTNESLFLKLEGYLENKLKSESSSGSETQALDFFDIYFIINNFSKTEQNAPFIYFQENPAVLEDFLGFLSFRGIEFHNGEKVSLKNILIREIREFIRLEIIYREAVKTGLENSPNVISALEMWRTNYLAQLSRKNLDGDIKVTEDEILNEYNKLKSSRSVNSVKVILASTKKLTLIENLLKSRSSSSDLEQAYQNLIDKGDIDLYKSSKFEPVGNFLNFGLNDKSDIGKLIGPVEYQSKYYLIEITDKKKFIQTDSLNRAEMEGMRQALYFKKLKERIDKKTIELADKYGVKVNYQLLGKIKVSSLNMVVMKYLGLGEKILAVPFTNQFFEWFTKWENRNKSPL